MFEFNSLDLTHFQTNYATDLSYMFHNCSSLTYLKINFNTQSVTTMQNMFSNCISLTSLELNTFNTKECKNFNNMFENDENLDLYINNETCSNLISELPEYINVHGIDLK